jgi:3-deoxy-manno-octulosonate cytidylyltransferase (CMP-KDO synthetase)
MKPKTSMKKAIFLDRDGTINIDYGYVSRPKDLHLLKNSGTTLRILQEKGYLLILITNQSGIGRKYYTLDNFFAVNDILIKKLSKYHVTIDDVFFCPHNPDDLCSCRKPSPSMVFKASKKWNIDLKKSFFIGDKISDILCGKNSGCKTIMIKNSSSKRKEIPTSVVEQADYTITNLKECIPIIERIEILQKKMPATAVIPARLQSSRMHHKMLQKVSGSHLFRYTYENLKKMGIFQDIIIATDSPRIYKSAKAFNAHVLMTSPSHTSGTSRISEISKKIKTPIIFNIQGDEPFISISHLDRLLIHMTEEKKTLAGTVITRIRDKKDILSPSVVKVVKDNHGYALYFSRHPIPFEREKNPDPVKYKHLGIYAYRKSFFSLYKRLKPSPLEISEKLEQLTFLSSGIKIKLFEAENDSLGIDVPHEMELFRKTVKKYPEYFKNLFS